MKRLLLVLAFLASGAAIAAADHVVTEEDNDQNKVIAQLAFKIEVLERKVAGMQKQITILHAKKSGKNGK